MIVESEYERGRRLEMIKEEATSKIRIEKEKQVIAELLNKTLSGTVGHGRHMQSQAEASTNNLVGSGAKTVLDKGEDSQLRSRERLHEPGNHAGVQPSAKEHPDGSHGKHEPCLQT